MFSSRHILSTSLAVCTCATLFVAGCGDESSAPVPAALTVAISSSTATEGDAPVSATVSVSVAPAADLDVALSSTDGTAASVPATVTIVAGTTLIPFNVTVMGDDGLADGDRPATINANATGLTGGSDSITVLDDETLALTVTLGAASVAEDGAAVSSTVSVNQTSVSSDLTVSLLSDSVAGTVPTTVTITAGTNSIPFDLTPIDDGLADDDRAVTITATATSYTQGSDSIDVTDIDTPTITLVLGASEATEGDSPVSSMVSVNTTLATNLDITLGSDDGTEASVSTTVTILAGNLSQAFYVTIEDDTDVDGDQIATISASATGYASDTGPITVHDNARYVADFQAADEDYVDFGSMAGFTAAGSWTIIERVKFPSGSTNGWHFFRGSAWVDSEGDVAAAIRTDAVHAWLQKSGWQNLIDSDTFAPDTWYDICIKHDTNTPMIELFVNASIESFVLGVPVADDSANTSPLYFGGQHYIETPTHMGEGDLYSECDIVIAHQAWIQRYITQVEMNNYGGTWNPSDADLFFSTEISASGITDASGNGHHGTNGNTPVFTLVDF